MEQRVKGHVAKLKEHADEVKSSLKRKKCAHESLQSIQGQINMVQKSREVLEFLSELNQRQIRKLEFLQDEIKLKQEEGQRSQVSEMDLKTHIAILELLVQDMESERDIQSLEIPTLKMQFERHLEKVTNLLRSMKFVREKGKLEFHTLTLKLREHIVEMNSLLEKIKLSLTLGKQLKERINELESFQEKIALVQLTEITKSQTEKMESEQMEELGCRTLEVKLEQHVKNSESLLIKVESTRDVVTQRPLTLRMELVEHSAKAESLLYDDKLKTERKRRSRLEDIKLKQEVSSRLIKSKRKAEQLESFTEAKKLTPGELKAPSTPITSQDLIVIGGIDHDDKSLTSVKMYIFLEGRWIGLPAMNTPRSFMSSVVVCQRW